MPLVSIIIPCYNEQLTIRWLLEAVCCQTYPVADMEVIIADGMSTDRTREIVALFAQDTPQLKIKLVDNARRIIPAALNTALSAAGGEFIIRLDAHSVPNPDYVERCIAWLTAGKADNVGGVWDIKPGRDNWMARSIAVAAAHPLGVGNALYRYTRQADYVDTVPFGSYRRDLFDRIGGFDENLLSNEDYEFNARLRQNGGRIWLDPQIRSTYFARDTLCSLVRQYWRYGFWKWKMAQRYMTTLKLRQVLPPLFVISLIGLLASSLFLWWTRWILGVEIAVYLLTLLVAALPVSFRRRDPLLVAGIPLAMATMHLSWGAGLLWSMTNSFINGLRKRSA